MLLVFVVYRILLLLLLFDIVLAVANSGLGELRFIRVLKVVKFTLDEEDPGGGTDRLLLELVIFGIVLFLVELLFAMLLFIFTEL